MCTSSAMGYFVPPKFLSPMIIDSLGYFVVVYFIIVFVFYPSLGLGFSWIYFSPVIKYLCIEYTVTSVHK